MEKRNSSLVFWLCILAGIAVRFALMIIMFEYYNPDFNNFCFTAELAAQGKNVYANTQYYNYGPIFFTLLGIFWKAASHFANNILVFRTLLVGLLTLADIAIALIIAKKVGKLWGAVFFLNPISIQVTSIQNQIDNVAVVLAAYAVILLESSSRQDKITLNDFIGVILLSLSLIAKHILFAFPLWILFNSTIKARKKALYAFIPPLFFLLSFVPIIQRENMG